MSPWKTVGLLIMLALCYAEVPVIHPKADVGRHKGRQSCQIDGHHDNIVLQFVTVYFCFFLHFLRLNG